MKWDLITTGVQGLKAKDDIYIPVFDIPNRPEMVLYGVSRDWYYVMAIREVMQYMPTIYTGELPLASAHPFISIRGAVVEQLPYLVRGHRTYVILHKSEMSYWWVVGTKQ